MKRIIIAYVLIVAMVLCGCSINITDSKKNNTVETTSNANKKKNDDTEFYGLNDPTLLTYIDDNVYQSVLDNTDLNEYYVENVESIYISQEYIDEMTYNSKENVFFGYSLTELNEQFEGNKYVFNVNDEGETEVVLFEEYELMDEETCNTIIKNVAIGTGVILICVTIAALAGGPAVTVIFAEAAKSAAVCALSSAVVGGSIASMSTYFRTGDTDEAIKDGALSASEGFKWGAIIGAISGGVSKYSGLKGATANGLTMDEAATIQRETNWSLDTIKQMKNMDEYGVYKNAGLKEQYINGQKVLAKEIDLNYVCTDSKGVTMSNFERMKSGNAPFDPETGTKYNLHHIGQKSDGTLAMLPSNTHQKYSAILHENGKVSQIDRSLFDTIRESIWKRYAEILGGNKYNIAA